MESDVKGWLDRQARDLKGRYGRVWPNQQVRSRQLNQAARFVATVVGGTTEENRRYLEEMHGL